MPHQHVGVAVELRVTSTTLEVLLRRQRIAAHARSAKLGERIGAANADVVRWKMEHRAHPEQGYRSCRGLMRLALEYGNELLEAACARAPFIRAPMP